jgi:hypothetical protein
LVTTAFKVRPFEERFHGPYGSLEVLVSGRIEDHSVVVCLGPHVVSVPVVATGKDEMGRFATIGEMTLPAGSGWVVRVEPEHKEWSFASGLGSGCRISVEKPADRGRYEEIARRAGADLRAAELIVPLEACFSVYLTSLGDCDGIGYSVDAVAASTESSEN